MFVLAIGVMGKHVFLLVAEEKGKCFEEEKVNRKERGRGKGSFAVASRCY